MVAGGVDTDEERTLRLTIIPNDIIGLTDKME